MSSGIIQTDYYYQPFIQKRNGDRIYSSRPLLVIQEGDHKVLCYLRDIDMSFIVRQNEVFTFGVMKILKTDKTKKEVLFEIEKKIMITNLQKGFQNREKGEVIWKEGNINIHWHIDLYQKEYIMSIPHISIKDDEICRIIK
jgi:hypothetical protein